MSPCQQSQYLGYFYKVFTSYTIIAYYTTSKLSGILSRVTLHYTTLHAILVFLTNNFTNNINYQSV